MFLGTSFTIILAVPVYKLLICIFPFFILLEKYIFEKLFIHVTVNFSFILLFKLIIYLFKLFFSTLNLVLSEIQ